MTEQQNNATGDAQGQPGFDVQRIYIKDTSFQAPGSTEYFLSNQHGEQPEIKLQLNTEARKLPDDLYEVTLQLSVTAQPKGSQTFIYQVEVKQAGLFAIRNVPEEDFMRLINTSCPGILFPFARQAISGLVERAGFTPMVLAPMNFDALHQQHLRLKQAGDANADPKH